MLGPVYPAVCLVSAQGYGRYTELTAVRRFGGGYGIEPPHCQLGNSRREARALLNAGVQAGLVATTLA
jgi:hypothetical protein